MDQLAILGLSVAWNSPFFILAKGQNAKAFAALLYWNQMPHNVSPHSFNKFLQAPVEAVLRFMHPTSHPGRYLSAGMNRNKKIFGKFKRTRFCGMIIAIRQFRRARRPCRTGKARRPDPWNKTQGHRVQNARPRVQKCLGTGKKTPGHVCRPASPNTAAWPLEGTPKRNLAACVLPAPGHAKRPVALFTAPAAFPKTAPRNCTKKGGIHP